jgi:DNA-binding IclR family transcriptional regulator
MAEELDLGRSTTHRYATTLVTLGYLEQGPLRKYRLSSRVCDVGISLLDSMVVRRVARKHLRDLRAQTGRTVSLGSLGGPRLLTSTVGPKVVATARHITARLG